jgi:hypothetical protein
LLLISIKPKNKIMEAYELNHNSISDKTKKESRVSLDNEKILCNHCKRTASNGIRCLGICVADNDY